MAASDVVAGVSAPECPFSGPGCVFGIDYAFRECYELVKPATDDFNAKSRVAACIFNRTNAFEQTLLSSASYILTLFPAFVGIIASFGPDATDIVCDNMWWSALFAATSAGLPGYVRDRPAHHVTVESFEQAEQMCKEWEYSRARSRTVARHMNPRVFAGAKVTVFFEVVLFLLSLALFVIFNYYFVTFMGKTVLFGRSSPYLAAVWYWMSASPSLLVLFAEILLDRVDLYEPRKHQTIAPSPMEQKSTFHVEDSLFLESHFEDGFASVPLSRQTATHQFAKVSNFTIPFFSKWLRVFGHQWRRTQYRLLIKPAPENWYVNSWSLIVGLFRLALFAVGSAGMGSVLLFPPGATCSMMLGLLVAASGLPRFSFPALWTAGPRGADLIVRVEPVEVRNTFSP